MTIEPQQDLHGYDYPWVGGTGKNIFDYTQLSQQARNVGITVDSNGYVYDESPSSDARSFRYSDSTWFVNLTAGTYTVLVDVDTITDQGFSVSLPDGTNLGGINIKYYGVQTITFTLSQDSEIGIYVKLYSAKIRVSIEKGESATSWVPYENICPINGLTQSIVNRCGKNICPVSEVTTSGSGLSSFFDLKAGTYTFSFRLRGSGRYSTSSIFLQESQQSQICRVIIGHSSSGTFSGQFTLTEDKSIQISVSNVIASSGYYIDNCQIEVGSQATDYAVYLGKQVTIQFGQTVYGGTVDYDSGKLIVTHVLATITTMTRANATDYWTTPSQQAKPNKFNTLCDKEKSASSATGSGVYVDSYGSLVLRTSKGYSSWADCIAVYGGSIDICYELATPITIQLSPQELELLKGNNYLTTNGASIRLVYQKDNAIGDIKKWVDERLDYYSLEEQETNEVWIDGKRIYKKTFNLTLTEGPSSAHMFEKNVDVTDLNIDMMISIDGVWRRTLSSGWNAYYQLGGSESGYGDSCGRLSSDKKTITLLFRTEGTNSQIFTIKYTKA